MGDLAKKISAEEYPDYLNPFDENYNGMAAFEEPKGKQKYNTWGVNRGNQVVAKQKEKHSFLDKPWAMLNISPRNKVVRRLSFLKSAVERFSPGKKRGHSSSFSEKNSSSRSHSLHDDFSFRIMSPKQKEKLRHQAFPALARQEQQHTDDSAMSPNSTQLNGRLTSNEQPDTEEEGNSLNNSKEPTDSCLTAGETSALGERTATLRKSRKKRRPPPPPPPMELPKINNTFVSNGEVKTDDADSACSSITQDLEKGIPSGDESSLAEFEFDRHKLEQKEYDITNIK